MPSRLTVKQFFAKFSTDDTCLNHVMNVRYELRHVCQSCGKSSTFHRIAARKAFSCANCGHHI